MSNINRMQGAPDEPLDITPIEMPLGACMPTPLQDIVARMVREQVALEKGEEFESWDEQDDFEEDDPDTLDMSPYELQELPDEDIAPTYDPDVIPDAAEASEAPQEQPGDLPNPDAPEPVQP